MTITTTSDLHVEHIETEEKLIALSVEWQQLAELQQPRLPFHTPEWSLAWWKHFREQRAMVSDRLYVRVVRDRSGKLVAVAPLMRTDRPGVGPLRIRVVQFFGADPNITEVRGLICHPDLMVEIIQELFKDLQFYHHEWDWIIWSGVSAHSPSYTEFSNLSEVKWIKETPDYMLDLPASWNEFREGLKHNIKESLRKCYNSLKRDNLNYTLRVAHERGEIVEALEHFFRLHSARANLTDTVFHNNVFDSTMSRNFLIDVCQRLCSNSTRIFLLEVSGKVVAVRIGFLLGDELYLYFSGFDPEYGKYSIMTTTVAEAIKWAISNKLKRVNLSTGKDVSKLRWGPYEKIFCEAQIQSKSQRGEISYNLYQAALRMRNNKQFQKFVSKLLTRRID